MPTKEVFSFLTAPIEFKDYDGAIEYMPKYSVISGINKTPFLGQMIITYIPDKHILEYGSFEQWIGTFGKEQYSIESLSLKVFKELIKVLDPRNLVLKVEAETNAHSPVRVVLNYQKRAEKKGG